MMNHDEVLIIALCKKYKHNLCVDLADDQYCIIVGGWCIKHSDKTHYNVQDVINNVWYYNLNIKETLKLIA